MLMFRFRENSRHAFFSQNVFSSIIEYISLPGRKKY